MLGRLYHLPVHFGTLGCVKSSVSIALFFLLSGLFLSTLLGAVERSRKLLGVAAVCLVAVACLIVFLTPVRLPSWRLGSGQDDRAPAVPSTLGWTISTVTTVPTTTTMGPTSDVPFSTEALGVRSR